MEQSQLLYCSHLFALLCSMFVHAMHTLYVFSFDVVNSIATDAVARRSSTTTKPSHLPSGCLTPDQSDSPHVGHLHTPRDAKQLRPERKRVPRPNDLAVENSRLPVLRGLQAILGSQGQIVLRCLRVNSTFPNSFTANDLPSVIAATHPDDFLAVGARLARHGHCLASLGRSTARGRRREHNREPGDFGLGTALA